MIKYNKNSMICNHPSQGEWKLLQIWMTWKKSFLKHFKNIEKKKCTKSLTTIKLITKTHNNATSNNRNYWNKIF